MLIITRALYKPGYDVRAKETGMGRGWKVYAENMAEAQQALAHYFAPDHVSGSLETCPLCRWSNAYAEKLKRQDAREAKRQAKIAMSRTDEALVPPTTN